MAGITGVGAVNVTTGFTARNCSVVTTRTRTDDMTVINSAGLNWSPRCRSRLVTGITGVGAINVACGFTGCHAAVMTARTDADDLCMIDTRTGNGRPQCREYRMAGITGIRSIYMVTTLTTGG